MKQLREQPRIVVKAIAAKKPLSEAWITATLLVTLYILITL